MNDKKALGVDNLPIQLLKRMGINDSYRLFLKWTNKRLKESEM